MGKRLREAASAFDQQSRAALEPLRQWSRQRLPALNKAIAAFERGLHETIFGPLTPD
jgi:hypothetical protein